MKRKVSATTRLLHDLFTQYPSTFRAFCELINNSIQAKSKNIEINIDYVNASDLFPTAVKKIVIKDDGVGVHQSELQEKLLDFGDSSKKGGKGVGRFAALQIGSDIEIESVGFDQVTSTFSKIKLPFSEQYIKSVKKVEELEIDTDEAILNGKNYKTYYKVTIKSIYDPVITGKNQKRKISEKLLRENVANSIFERYPLIIFNKTVRFKINGKHLNPNDFIDSEPIKLAVDYEDKKGKTHTIYFTYIKLKSTIEEIKVFLTSKNVDVDTIIGGFEFEADWLGPKSKGWFVYIHAKAIQTDLYRSFELDEMDDDSRRFKGFIKSRLNEFFKSKNKEYEDFVTKLKKDNYYPYKDKENATSQSKVTLFEKLAYLVEEKYNLINGKSKLREIIYPLIDRTIVTGELDKIMKKMLHLDNRMVKKFDTVLDRTEMEDVIEFSEKVSRKLEDLLFIEKLTCTELSKRVRERKELHKVLEKTLWIFGEQYLENINLDSDTNLQDNLHKLAIKTMAYKSQEKDDNINKSIDKKAKSITDLFLYSEKPIDEIRREVLIVELKAPKVKISPIEIQQVLRYAQEIEKSLFFTESINFNILLISSEINSTASYQMESVQRPRDNPYFFYRNKKGNITISIMRWADLLENNKRKLKFMSTRLKIKDIDVEQKIKNDFDEIRFDKISSTLRKVNIPA